MDVQVRMIPRERGPVRIERDIRHDERVPRCRHPARDTLPERNAQPAQGRRLLANRDRIVQVVGFLIDHQQRPAFRAEEVGHLIHDGQQNLFQIKCSRQRTRHVMEHPEVIHLAAFNHFELTTLLHASEGSRKITIA